MPDITMCNGGDCPLKETCYRYKAKPSEFQSYLAEIPYNAGATMCEYFCDMSPRDTSLVVRPPKKRSKARK